MLLNLLYVLNARLNLIKNEEGQDFAEYGLLLAVIAVLVVGALAAFRGSIEGVLESVGDALTNVPE